MSARKPKPSQLKELNPQSSDPAKLGLSRLFASANVQVSLQPSIQRSFIVNDDKTLKLEVLRQETQTPLHPQESTKVSLALTRASQLNRTRLIPTNVTSVQTNEPVSPQKAAPKLQSRKTQKKQKQSNVTAWVLFISAIGLFSYIGFAPGLAKHPNSSASQLTDTQIQERLDFHRDLTGTRLNRERIDVQLRNHFDAPDLPIDAHKVKVPDMMSGLPLAGEQNLFAPRQKADWPVNPSHPDAKIMYGLQEEQDRVYFEKQARKAWLTDFIENARKDGYAVQIDRFGNVKTKRIPEADREPSSNTETGLNSSATTDTLIDY